MFLEKFSRFFRQYELEFHPRHKGGVHIPLMGNKPESSVQDALRRRIDSEEALNPLPNGDLVELMDVQPNITLDVLTLLFHKTSPNAAEPMYRKKARKKVSVRAAVKEPDEEQAVSAHMIVSLSEFKQGKYRAVLEEIPGMSMGALQPIIGQALAAYPYKFANKRGQKEETYSVFKAEGVKGETIGNALKTGIIREIKLVRTADVEMSDAEGLFIPTVETMKVRVSADIEPKDWQSKFVPFVARAKAKGWEDFNIEIDFLEHRSRSVKLDRDAEAKEVLFIRAEKVDFKAALEQCSTEIVNQIEQRAAEMIKGEWSKA